MDSPNSDGMESPRNENENQLELLEGEPLLSQQMEEEESDLTSSFFPSPSHYYKLYTTENLALPLNTPLVSTYNVNLDSATISTSSNSIITTNDLLPPRVDWIVERGSYCVFGQSWPVEEVLPSLSELGLQELFSKDQDRSASLLVLLRALLLTYTSLISSLLSPPPSILSQQPPPSQSNGYQQQEEVPTDPERFVEHIRLISINMHHLVNELRPVQARETLKNMMRSQIEARKLKTLAIKKTITDLRTNLVEVKSELSEYCTRLDSFDVTVEEDEEDMKELGRLSENDRIKRDFERLKEAVDLLG